MQNNLKKFGAIVAVAASCLGVRATDVNREELQDQSSDTLRRVSESFDSRAEEGVEDSVVSLLADFSDAYNVVIERFRSSLTGILQVVANEQTELVRLRQENEALRRQVEGLQATSLAQEVIQLRSQVTELEEENRFFTDREREIAGALDDIRSHFEITVRSVFGNQSSEEWENSEEEFREEEEYFEENTIRNDYTTRAA